MDNGIVGITTDAEYTPMDNKPQHTTDAPMDNQPQQMTTDEEYTPMDNKPGAGGGGG